MEDFYSYKLFDLNLNVCKNSLHVKPFLHLFLKRRKNVRTEKDFFKNDITNNKKDWFSQND